MGIDVDAVLKRYDPERMLSIEVPAFGPASSDPVAAVESLAASPALLSIEVPEFSAGADLPWLYFHPFTLADSVRIEKRAKGSDHRRILFSLIFKALDENGAPLFTERDRSKLMSMDPIALSEIVIRMRDRFGLDSLVPEYTTKKPFVMHFHPFTLAAAEEVNALSAGDMNRNIAAHVAVQALDADGERMFRKEHIDALMRIPDAVCMDIVVRMRAEQDERSYEETVKK